MKIRPPDRISASEYDQVVALWRSAGLHSLRPQGRDSREAFADQSARGQVVLGLEDEGKLVACVVITDDTRKGWINRLAVHPQWRKQGVGQKLIEAAEQRLHEQGMDVVAALIEPENDVSLALFQKAGYADFPGLHYVSKRSREDV